MTAKQITTVAKKAQQLNIYISANEFVAKVCSTSWGTLFAYASINNSD
ncbi:MAG: hypothetical protein JKY81_12925 [Colwellia sp.]|nr:hypothetical protein [Colwellia sp.]